MQAVGACWAPGSQGQQLQVLGECMTVGRKRRPSGLLAQKECFYVEKKYSSTTYWAVSSAVEGWSGRRAVLSSRTGISSHPMLLPQWVLTARPWSAVRALLLPAISCSPHHSNPPLFLWGTPHCTAEDRWAACPLCITVVLWTGAETTAHTSLPACLQQFFPIFFRTSLAAAAFSSFFLSPCPSHSSWELAGNQQQSRSWQTRPGEPVWQKTILGCDLCTPTPLAEVRSNEMHVLFWKPQRKSYSESTNGRDVKVWQDEREKADWVTWEAK